MNSLLNKTGEKTFLKTMHNYVDTIKILEQENKFEASCYYQLCFYCGLYGFIDKCFRDNHDLTEIFFEHMSIDTNILLNYLYNENPDNSEWYNANYCYTMGHIIDYENPNKTLKKLLDMHLSIYTAIYEQREKDKNEIAKKFFLSINSITNKTTKS